MSKRQQPALPRSAPADFSRATFTQCKPSGPAFTPATGVTVPAIQRGRVTRLELEANAQWQEARRAQASS